jgi:hypothetical protein
MSDSSYEKELGEAGEVDEGPLVSLASGTELRFVRLHLVP